MTERGSIVTQKLTVLERGGKPFHLTAGKKCKGNLAVAVGSMKGPGPMWRFIQICPQSCFQGHPEESDVTWGIISIGWDNNFDIFHTMWLFDKKKTWATGAIIQATSSSPKQEPWLCLSSQKEMHWPLKEFRFSTSCSRAEGSWSSICNSFAHNTNGHTFARRMFESLSWLYSH